MYKVFRIRIGFSLDSDPDTDRDPDPGFLMTKKNVDKKFVFFKILQFLSLGLQDVQATG